MIGGTQDRRVRVRVTLADPARTGARVDVEVEAPAGTRLGALAEPLLAAVGHPADPFADGLFVDGESVTEGVLGLPPLLNGAIVTVGRAGGVPGRWAGTAGGLVEVHVVAGPDAGSRHPLGPGATWIGRGVEAGLRITDPDVSRLHAEIVATGMTVEVRDLGSTNGTLLADRAVGAGGGRWEPGQLVQVGGSTLALRLLDASPESGGGPAAAVPDGVGQLLVNPAPRLRPPPVTGVVSFPEPPPSLSPPRLPWLAILLPLLLSVPLAWWMKQVIFLAFALLSPLMMIGQYLVDRRDRAGERAGAQAGYDADLETARDHLDELLAAERARLLLDHLDPAAIAAVAAGPLQRLWERRAGDGDETRLRLGLGSRRSVVEVRGAAADEPPPHLPEAPITLDLDDPAVGGVAGLAGPRGQVLALARGLVAQAAVTTSPHRLRVVVLTCDGDPAGDWAWAAWLPHATAQLPPPDVDPAGAADPGDGDPVPGPRFLVVLDGAARLRREPAAAALLATAGRRVLALCLDDDPAHLPAECGATVELSDGSGAEAVLCTRGGDPQELRPDLVSGAWAERLARDLARLEDATPAGSDAALPAQIRLLDLVAGPEDARSLATIWSRRRAGRDRATTAVLGLTATGPWQLDLARHGPHALVAGTTGAGKSELLTTLVASLALSHPPDRINLLLVDYKGGTAFGPLVDLPHTAGLLTDLDEHLARRALSSLRAELRRREALLRVAGAADLDGYDRSRSPGAPPLARLVIVVDEFRVLSEELPDLLTGLVRVAVVGRSLGVHLVLATQRPAGVVTAEMRANVNLRIALRVRDRMDSEDVVESPDAASLPSDRPGRGLFRVGGEPLVEFQAARAGGRATPSAAPARVRTVERRGPVATAWFPRTTPTGPGPGAPGASVRIDAPAPAEPRTEPDDLAAIVAVCRAAAAVEGVTPARPPWLPPLPTVVRPGDLPRLLGSPTSVADACDGGGDALVLPLGVVDLPEQQARAALTWALGTDGHLAIVGAPGSGRSAAVRAVAGAADRCDRPVHVHVVDGGGRLGDLIGLPRVGSVVPAGDTERAARLLARLGERARCRHGAAGSEVPLLLLVDGWEQVLDAWLPVDHGRLVDELLRLTRDGLGTGVRIAVTGGRALLGGQVAGVLTERLLLRAADPTDLVLAGVPASALPASMPPGRALRVFPGARVVEAQITLEEPVDGTDGANSADGANCSAHGANSEPPPLHLAPLPDHVEAAELVDVLCALPGGPPAVLDGGRLPIGLGGDDAGPLGPAATGPGWLVAGPPGSGRSTALACAATVLLAAGRDVVVIASNTDRESRTDRESGAGGRRIVVPPASIRSGAADLIGLLDEHPGATLVVDDVACLADTPLEDALLARLDAAPPPWPWPSAPHHQPSAPQYWPAGPGPHVLAACTPAQAAIAFRGLLARLRATGTGVLLAPVAPGDGEAFGVRATVSAGAPPGRALLVEGPAVRAVQVASTRRR